MAGSMQGYKQSRDPNSNVGNIYVDVVMENQMEKHMEDELGTKEFIGMYRDL